MDLFHIRQIDFGPAVVSDDHPMIQGNKLIDRDTNVEELAKAPVAVKRLPRHVSI